MKILLIALSFILLTNYNLSAAEINGRVTDARGNPIPSVSVYFSGTTIGTRTKPDGTFVIKDIKNGDYKLIISGVSYNPENREINLKKNDILTFNFKLTEKEIVTDGIEISGRNWQELFEEFKLYFWGDNKNADKAKILNPEELILSEKNIEGKTFLYAESKNPLIIENKYLGYMLTVNLHQFIKRKRLAYIDKDVWFEEMEPENGEQRIKWRKHRESTYEGGFLHFCRSLIAGTTEDEGFSLYPVINGEDGDEMDPLKDGLVEKTNEEGYYSIRFADSTNVYYSRKFLFWASREVSLLEYFGKMVWLDSDGKLIDPNHALIINGKWGNNLLWSTLPYNYKPE